EAVERADLVITSYALLRRDVELLERVDFRIAVLDEAQHVKNADAATTAAARRLRADMKLVLTGTPVENRLRDLWTLLDLVNPGMLGTARRFEDNYERAIVQDVASPQAERLRALVRPFVLRRTKKQVLV